MIVGAFLAGFLSCLLLLLSGLVIFFVILPDHKYRKSDLPERILREETDWDQQLCKAGWFQLSQDVLNYHEIGAKDTPITTPNWMDKSQNIASFLISRFMGEINSVPIFPKLPAVVYRKWKTVFGVLKQKTLYIYIDESQAECVQVLLLSHYTVQLNLANVSPEERFSRYNPIRLISNNGTSSYYFYCLTGSDKEDWFILFTRVKNLPSYGDCQALSTYHQDTDSMRSYLNAMEKLIENTSGENPDHSTAWLNALLGRFFIAMHANDYIKNWLVSRFSRRSPKDESSFLGDILIKKVNVGNSLPVLSNPKLLNITLNGDLMVEMDIDYTGGISIEAATLATISVPAWDSYLKPITIPLVVAITIKKFSARVLLKLKPFWESNRLWFGFYRKPELKLELQVEPIISNKLIKSHIVNQVIEQRIKNALDEYVMLPNMDDIMFWDSEVQHIRNHSLTIPDEKHEFSDNEDVFNASMVGEAVESTLKVSKNATGSVLFRETLDDQSSSKEVAAVKTIGDTIFNLGELSRKYGIDKSASTVVSNAVEYSKTYTSKVKEAAVSTIERLGLAPEKTEEAAKVLKSRKLNHRASLTWNLLGFKVETIQPNPDRIRQRRLLDKNSQTADVVSMDILLKKLQE